MKRMNLIRAVSLVVVCAGLWGCGGADKAEPVDIQATVAAQVEATLAASKSTEAPTDEQLPSAALPTATPTSESTVIAGSQGKIAFVSGRNDQNGEIYVMNADGSDVYRLTHHDRSDLNTPYLLPTWSPNGKQIAFITMGHNPADLLFIMNSNGEDLTQLASDVDGYEPPAWSPRGDQIAYVSRPGEMLTLRRTDGSEVTPLVRTPRFKAPITWLNDEQIMGFMINSSVCSESFCISDTKGTDVTGFLSWEQIQEQCPYHGYAAADWSTESGLTLLCDVEGTARIYVWGLDRTAPSLLAQLDSMPIDHESFYYSVALFRWSPDYTNIALGYNNQLYIYHVDTGETRLVASDLNFDTGDWQYNSQVWSPDSRMITLASDGDILVIDIESGSIANLTFGESPNAMPAWSP